MNPENFPTGIKYSYEPTTGTAGLRKHIKNVHIELYKQLCANHNIQPSESFVGKQTPDEAPTLPATREPFNKDTLLALVFNTEILQHYSTYSIRYYQRTTDRKSVV